MFVSPAFEAPISAKYSKLNTFPAASVAVVSVFTSTAFKWSEVSEASKIK